MKVTLKDIRGSYVYLTAPRKDSTDAAGNVIKGKYGVQIILPKNHPQVKQVKAAIVKVAREKFGSTIKLGMLKLPLRDGDEEREGEEYENAHFMNANGNKKPGIVNRFNQPPSDDDLENMCFSGAYFHMTVNFYPFNHDGKKGVAVGLNNVMLRKPGERLDGTSSAPNDFADMADDGADDEGFDEFEDDDDIPC